MKDKKNKFEITVERQLQSVMNLTTSDDRGLVEGTWDDAACVPGHQIVRIKKRRGPLKVDHER